MEPKRAVHKRRTDGPVCIDKAVLEQREGLGVKVSYYSHTNRMSRTFSRSTISRLHFRDLVCWVLWVKHDEKTL